MVEAVNEWYGVFRALSFRGKVVVFATAVVLVELGLRRFAPTSRAYRRWTGFFEAIGSVWTVALLAVVYFVSVSVIAMFVKLFAKDPLDRGLEAAPSFWRAHEPNPLGPKAAARHQF